MHLLTPYKEDMRVQIHHHAEVWRTGGEWLDRISLPMLIEPMYDDENAPKEKEENSQYKIKGEELYNCVTARKEGSTLMFQTSHF